MSTNVRSNQIKNAAAKAGVSMAETRRDSSPFVVERLVNFGVSKIYNAAMSIAAVFSKPALNDVSLLSFEMSALKSFMPVIEYDEIENKISTAVRAWNDLLLKVHETCGIELIDQNEALLAQVLAANDAIINLIADVHALYKDRVTFRNIF